LVSPKPAGHPPPQPPAPSFAAEEARAAAELARLAGKTSSEILGLPPRSTMLEARQAFFAKVKTYHPTQLPAGAPEKLRQSYAQLTEVLSSALAQFKPDPLPAAAQVEVGPFGGWRKGPDQKVWIELNITPDRASIFTDVQAASIANGGFFLPCDKALPIFEVVEVKLRFQAPSREILGSGRVITEVNLPNKRGLGVRFLTLAAEDKRFIEYYVKRSQPPR
jgi:hypothetical protein